MAGILCNCGKYFSTDSFPSEFGFKMFSEVDYDKIDDPVNRKTLEELYLNSTSVYECPYCKRFVILKKDGVIEFWTKEILS